MVLAAAVLAELAASQWQRPVMGAEGERVAPAAKPKFRLVAQSARPLVMAAMSVFLAVSAARPATVVQVATRRPLRMAAREGRVPAHQEARAVVRRVELPDR